MKYPLALIAISALFNVVVGTSFIHDKAGVSQAKISPSSNLSSVLSLRGGAVLEPTTLQEVQDIIMKASAEGKAVVIDFSATWCGPCKMISPMYHEFSDMDEFSNVVFLKVDVDENPDTAARYNVSAMPTFLFIKQGAVVDTLMGANPAKLKEMIEDIA